MREGGSARARGQRGGSAVGSRVFLGGCGGGGRAEARRGQATARSRAVCHGPTEARRAARGERGRGHTSFACMGGCAMVSLFPSRPRGRTRPRSWCARARGEIRAAEETLNDRSAFPVGDARPGVGPRRASVGRRREEARAEGAYGESREERLRSRGARAGVTRAPGGGAGWDSCSARVERTRKEAQTVIPFARLSLGWSRTDRRVRRSNPPPRPIRSRKSPHCGRGDPTILAPGSAFSTDASGRSARVSSSSALLARAASRRSAPGVVLFAGWSVPRRARR